MKTIDVHAHVLPPSFYEMAKDGTIPAVVFEPSADNPKAFRIGAGGPHPNTPLFYDIPERIKWLDEKRIDMQVISISPRLFFYEFDAAAKARVYRRFNDDIAQMAADCPERFIPMGTLPMQDAGQAVSELRRITSGLGFRTVQIGTTVCGRNLTEPDFFTVFEEAGRLGVTVMLHPLIQNAGPLLAGYHLSNTVGNPFQTVTAAANLLFSGIFDRLPELRILLVHGGGYLPFQVGRLMHGYTVRKEATADCRHSPEHYIRQNIWFDGLTHSKNALKYLLDTFGTDKVLFGTDDPYDMAGYDQLACMAECGYSQQDIERVACNNFHALQQAIPGLQDNTGIK